jgi:hypothetical protein
MKYLLRSTFLNKNICNIIFKYIDYSKTNLISLIKNYKVKNTRMKLKDNLIDLIVLCVKLGCRGFFIENINQGAIKIIEYYYNKHKITNSAEIEITINHDRTFYFIKELTDDYKCVNLVSLGVFETITF